MYAVVSSGGKQYRVEQGTTLLVDRLTAEPGASITFDRVLLVSDGDAVMVGTPLVTGATVTGTVLGEERGPKLIIFKFKQKVKYRRRTGHRQQMTRVRIDAISADGKKPARRAAEAAPTDAPAETPAAPKPRATRARATKAASTAKAEPKARAKAAAKPKATATPADASDTTAEDKPKTTRRRSTSAKAKE